MASESQDCGKRTKPEWLRVRAPGSEEYLVTRSVVKSRNLHTVCEEAQCPNIGECWSHSTATFLIMGDTCSRNCHFCAVKKGKACTLLPLDPEEPERVGMAVRDLNLKHAVITSVTRDDIPDGGASHFAMTASAIHHHAPECRVELLIPDFQGREDDIRKVMDSRVDILNHNVETVPSLYCRVRPSASYARSLSVLSAAKKFDSAARTKSGIMVGLGETKEEVLSVMDDLLAHNVDIVTIGQYLQPGVRQVPVRRFVHPDEFLELEKEGLRRGFSYVESGPLVRSSYHAWKHTCSVPD